MTNIIKRNGESVEYEGGKIIIAIKKAMEDADERLNDVAHHIEFNIRELINASDEDWSVEDVSDEIENQLMDSGLHKVAKEYILYRDEKSKTRNKKWEMTNLQRDIYNQKYRFGNQDFEEFLNRVSGGNKEIAKLIRQKKFLFGGRILANRKLNELDNRKITLSNCYVITPPEDNLESIFDTAKKLARTYSYGGGCGIDISKLRPNGAVVNNNAESTSGAVSFMSLYSLTTGLIGQKGRRGALMISINTSHPDIEEFIDIKSDLEKVTKANISIFATDEFFRAVESRKKYNAIFKVEDTGEEIIKEIDAYNVFHKLCYNSWDVAEPAVLYEDRIDNYHLLQHDENFEFSGVNPCAEEPLPAGGSCLLGSLNLSEFVVRPNTTNAYFDFDKFDEAVRIAVTGLNEVLDEGLPLHPLSEQRNSVNDLRQIGLGIMGLADMLIKLGIRYGSEKSMNLSDEIGFAMANKAIETSALLAKEQGPFNNYNESAILRSDFLLKNSTKSTRKLVKQYGLRNSQLLTIAPTGSLSTMFGISGGIEPIFNISYTRKTETLNNGEDTYYKVYTPIAQEYMEENDLTSEQELPNTFVTAMTLKPIERVKMQSVWQRHIDASISSTVNLPNDATVEDVEEVYLQAWKHGLKGITVYRDGCRRGGILLNKVEVTKDYEEMNLDELESEIEKLNTIKTNKEVQAPTCPECGEALNMTGGCSECPSCGWSKCSL